MNWKAGDWVVLDRKVGQIKEMKDNGVAIFSDGMFETSGMGLATRFRPLTLRNKYIAESMEYKYRQLDKMDGSAGFNFPDISRYFAQLVTDAIDAEPKSPEEADAFERANKFLQAASEYKPMIDGVLLFRPQI